MTFSTSNLSTESLLSQCEKISYTQGISIKKQSLDERFNDASVEFLRQLLQTVIRKHIQSEQFEQLIPKAKRIRIKDSTSFELPNEMAEYYRGSGGKSSNSCVKIQFEFDLKTGDILELSLGHYTKTDTTNSHETIDNVYQGDLLIRDLGYVSLIYLENVQIKEAYFLNRIRSDVSVWIKQQNGEFIALDFEKIESQMRKTRIQNCEYTVFLGNNKKVESRLIIECLPTEVKVKKLRKAHLAAKREGRQLGKVAKSKVGLNVFITNMKESDLPFKQVWSLYRLRWQIELMFKTWKSTAQINKIKKVKRQRLECYLYGKLLWIVLGWRIFRYISNTVQTNGVWISINKFMKSYKEFCSHIISQ